MKSAFDSLIFALAIAGACACSREPPANGHAAKADPIRCADCHMPEFMATNHPPHEEARPTSCGVCHTQGSWHQYRVDHPGWELTGAHARAAADKELAGKEKQVKCFWCHRGEPDTYEKTKKECVSCHDEDREAASSPDHAHLPLTCEECHTTDAWKPATKRVAEHADAPVDAGHSEAGGGAPRPTATAPPKPPPRPTTTSRPIPTTTPTAKPIPTTTPTAPPDVTSRPSRRR